MGDGSLKMYNESREEKQATKNTQNIKSDNLDIHGGASPQITAPLAASSTRHYIIPNLRNVISKWENADEEDEANDISRAQKHVGKSFKVCFDRK